MSEDVPSERKVEVLHVNLPFISVSYSLTHQCYSTIMPLNDQQREALEQLWAVTASTSDASRQRDERMLTENRFDVQVRTLPPYFCSMLIDVEDGRADLRNGRGYTSCWVEVWITRDVRL
jgi:hypothetical protein